jgi:hypothetical protein
MFIASDLSSLQNSFKIKHNTIEIIRSNFYFLMDQTDDIYLTYSQQKLTNNALFCDM